MTEPGGDSSGVKIFPPLIAAVAIIAGLVLESLWALPIVAEGTRHSLRLGGFFIVAMWLLLAVSAVVTFRRAGTTPNPTKPTTALAFGGPYRFTRNPMYLGLVLLVVGLALVMNSIWLVILAVPVLLLLRQAVILKEERYLKGKFGDDYLAYKKRVRRWI